MLLIDVNILLLSYRDEIPGADGIADWLTAVARGSEASACRTRYGPDSFAW